MVRIKQRYILGELVFADSNSVDSNITQKKVLENFRRVVHELYGDVGLAKIQPNFLIKFWNVTTRIFILRVGRDNCDTACTSLAFLTNFEEPATEVGAASRDRPCRARILHVGGTLEKVEFRYKQLSEAWLESSMLKQ
mmetsp:Transcript_16357/g.22108  ORF Transcript_16357/g.22108 Transcript_16357/m.22108 type:complete len:138 (+) Transcript_16357:30-443(+)